MTLPMARTDSSAQRRRSAYAWCTWLTPALSGDAQCLFASWFQAHHMFDKVERGDFNLATWKVEHANLVDARAYTLQREGYTVYLEGQNKFTLQGTRLTLAGKPDLVAIRDDEARVIDIKTGRRRDSDLWQVCLYQLALPLQYAARLGTRSLVGEVQYRDGSVAVPPLTAETRAHLVQFLTRLGDPTPPAKVPSASECRFCPIGAWDCPERITEPEPVVAVGEF